MINLEDKKVYFSGVGETFEKEELIRFILSNGASIVENLKESDIIISGYKTPVYDEDRFYLYSKEYDKSLFTIEEFEKYFSENFDIDSVFLSIKISKDQTRLLKLLKNRYLTDDVFLKLLKLYNWNNQGLYDSDENRDVSTAIVSRFSKIQQINHNIQHSPIGIYYTALETNNSKLLDTVYSMPNFQISDKNAKPNQPLNLKQVCAINPNISKALMMQILKSDEYEVLKFLALNQSIGKMIVDKLLEKEDIQINQNLLETSLLHLDEVKKLFRNDSYQKTILTKTVLDDVLFDFFLSQDLTELQYLYLSTNESLNEVYIKKLFQLDIANVNINLLKNSLCPKEYLQNYLEKDDSIYHIAIAHNENLTDEFIEKLFGFDNINIDLSLASNSAISKAIAQKLYVKNNEQINIFLAQNSSTPIGILMQLQVDSRYVSDVAKNETYKEYSRNSLGIINEESQFKRSSYVDKEAMTDEFWKS